MHSCIAEKTVLFIVRALKGVNSRSMWGPGHWHAMARSFLLTLFDALS